MGLHSKQRSCFDITHSSISFWAQKWELGRLKQAFSIPNTSAYTHLLKKKKKTKKRNQTPRHWIGFHLQFALTKTIQKALEKGLEEVAACNWGAAARLAGKRPWEAPPNILGTPWNVLGSPCFIWTTCELCRPPHGLKNMQLSYGCPTVSCGN